MTAETMTLIAETLPAIATARHALADRLALWQCGNIADCLLVFSELVTNAVTHAGGAPRILVTHDDEVLRFDVDDRTHSSPERRASGVDGGFGLRIVARLSDGWGWDQTSSGKTVWSELSCAARVG